MAIFQILTTLPLPPLTIAPSANCLQWSADGQAILLAKNAIYILTPDLGLSTESFPIKPIKESGEAKNIANPDDKPFPVRWLRTIMEWDKIFNTQRWGGICQEWSTVSLDVFESSFRAVTCSPSSLTEETGCIYAVLSSNYEVSLCRPAKNHFTSKWVRLENAIEVAWSAGDSATSAVARTLQIQATCIAWSSQVDFGTSPAPSLDASLLAIGTKSGRVSFLRYQGKPQERVEFVTTAAAGDRWICHLAWSDWASLAPGNSQAYLACALTDGSISILKVMQSLRRISPNNSFLAEYEVDISTELLEDRLCEGQSGGISCVRWLSTLRTEPVLVFSKPGIVYVCHGTSSHGLRELRLKTQKLSVGSSRLKPVSGFAHVRKHDAVVLSLTDGSFHVINRMSSEPFLGTGFSDGVSTGSCLSEAAREVFGVVEGGIQDEDVNYIQCMASYDGGSCYALVQQPSRPMDFDYKSDGLTSNTFILAQLCDGSSDQDLITEIQESIANSRAHTGDTTIAILRSIFLQLREPDRVRALHEQIAQALRSSQPFDDTVEIVLPPWTGTLTAELREKYCASLRMHIFGQNTLFRQRIRIALCRFCEMRAGDHEAKAVFAQIGKNAVSELWPRILRILIRHITAVQHVLSAEDAPFVLRIVVQTLLPGTPADVMEEAQELARKVNADHRTLAELVGLEESCPACQAPVALEDIHSATCPNGHTWLRCCATSFIMSTPSVRTCVGCGRKALLPVPENSKNPGWLPTAARVWLVEELLNASRRCFFCGGTFTTLV